eukprot:Em0011g649a
MYTVDFKLKVLDWYHKNGESGHVTSKHFEIDRRMLRNWLAKEDCMKKTRCRKEKKHLYPASKGPHAAVDAAVLAYLTDERSAGRPVSNKQLRAKTMEEATKLNVPASFKASDMWLKRWKKRNHVSMQMATNDSQKVPEDYRDVLHTFRSDVLKLVVAHGYTPARIVNMDQTMCRFDMPPNRTNHAIGSRSIRIANTKAAKKGFTVALAAYGCGVKLPALIIFKEKGGKLGPRVSKSLTIPSNVRVMASANGWMTSSLYHWWLRHIYSCDKDNRRLLLVDNYRPHLTDDSQEIVTAECNSDLLFIPAGCTPLVQPMDVSVNRPFKQAMRDNWLKWMSSNNERTAHGNLKQPTRQHVINWISAAWDNIKAESIIETFMRCGITAAADGSDDEKMFSHIPRVIVEEDLQEGEDAIENDDDVDEDTAEYDNDDDGMVTGDDFDQFDSDED